MLDYPESRDDRVNPPSLLYRLEDWSMGRKRSFKSYMKVTARALPSSHELTTLFLTHLLTSSLTYSLTYLLTYFPGRRLRSAHADGGHRHDDQDNHHEHVVPLGDHTSGRAPLCG